MSSQLEDAFNEAVDLCYGSRLGRGPGSVSYAYGLWALVRIGHRAVAWSWRNGLRTWRNNQSAVGLVVGIDRWPNT